MSTAPYKDRETEEAHRLWEKQARTYDLSMSLWEKVLFRGDRAWVCSKARGAVLEIAVGTGLNLPHYPDAVRLTGIDLSEEMLDRARSRARDLGREVDLRVGDAQALEFPGDSFDTAVSTFSLCSVPDYRKAIAEMRRVLRPGGQVLLAEHVRSDKGVVRVIERILELVSRGDHYLRQPLDGLRAEGFIIDALDRRRAGFVQRIAAHKRGSLISGPTATVRQ